MEKRTSRAGSTNLNSESIRSLYGSTTLSMPIMNVISIILGALAIVVLAIYSFQATSPYVIGENLVEAEVNIGLMSLKPITLFMYLFFLSYGFGLASPISKQRLIRIPDQAFESLYVFAWFWVMLSGFEVLYNCVVLWTAGLAVQGLQNPDIIVNWWPANPYAINVVFAAKLVVLIFAVSCFTVDYLRRIRSTRERVRESIILNGGNRTSFRT